jgi:vitamin B12 transporter
MPRTLSLTLLAVALAAVEEATPTIVVTAERGESDLDAATISVEFVTIEQVVERGGAINATDWLRDLPGVGVWSTNGGIDGGNVTVRIRGLDSKYTMFLVDGIPIEDQGSIDGSPRSVFLQPAGLQVVEIAKGPQSGLYGSGAIGGVVAMQTARPTRVNHAEFSLTGGSFDTAGGSATVTGPLGTSAGFAASFNGISSAGITAITNAPDGNSEGHESDGLQRYSGTIRLEAYPSDDGILYIAGSMSRARQEFDDSFAATPPEDSLSENFYRTWRLFGGGTWKVGDSFSAGGDVAITDTQNTVTSAFPYSLDSRQYFGQGHVRIATESRIAATMGVDARRDEAYFTSTASANLTGSYLQVAYDDEAFYASATGRLDHHSEYGNNSTWRFAGAWQAFPERLKLRGAVASGFRAPGLYQIIGDGLWVAANPDLNPETSRTYEGGIDATLCDGLQLMGTVFHSEVTDLIDWGGVGYANVPGRTRSDGAEVSMDLHKRLTTDIGLSANATYTYLDSESASRQPTAYSPEHAGSLRLGTDQRLADQVVVRQGIGIRRTTSYQADSTGTSPVEGATLADLSAGVAIGEMWDVALRVDNLFDERYVVNRSFGTIYATAPRSYWLTVTGRF